MDAVAQEWWPPPKDQGTASTIHENRAQRGRVLSSAFARAVKWGLIKANPVTASEPPVPRKRRGIALTTDQQEAIVAAATGPWCVATFLELSAGTGARRGEVLALRWSDIEDGRAVITRS